MAEDLLIATKPFVAAYSWANRWKCIYGRIARHKAFRDENPARILTPFYVYFDPFFILAKHERLHRIAVR
jgi:hypothetical protein